MESLWDEAVSPGALTRCRLQAAGAAVALGDLRAASAFGGHLESLRGSSVLVAPVEQLAAGTALLELDGVAGRIVLCTPDLTPQQLTWVAKVAECDAVVTDAETPEPLRGCARIYRMAAIPQPLTAARRSDRRTEWVLLTSGTTGTPKLVVHSLESLGGTLPRRLADVGTVWSTFYDIRRYGGLQIFLRAVLGGAPLVLSNAHESTEEFIARAAASGVTHISGTPSHWRKALMSGALARFKPDYVRLSGEVADQPVRDALQTAFPHARIGHAFASTEAGVAFDVNDGLAGFPAALIDRPPDGIEFKIESGTLRIRSGRNAVRYLGDAPASLAAGDGFVDTGDMVELENGRYYFRGRRGGVINVGGLKVYTEEVESVLNADPRVRMSLVRARRSPITGAIVVADVVLADGAEPREGAGGTDDLKTELLNACRRALPEHKVPAMLRLVPSLELTAAGKLVRP